MVGYRDLNTAPLGGLKDVVDEWNQAVKCLADLENEIGHTVRKPLKDSEWEGKDADNGFDAARKIDQEFDDALAEAKGIRNILDDLHRELDRYQRELRQVANEEASAKRVRVDSSGEVHLDSDRWVNLMPNGPGPSSGPQARAAVAAIEERLREVLSKANDVDRAAAAALNRNLDVGRVGFEAPKVTDIDDWRKRSEKRYQDAMGAIFGEMMRNSRDMADHKGNYVYFGWKVRPGGPWDHKPYFLNNYGVHGEGTDYFKVPGQDREVYYDVFSNLHYGYVGKAGDLGEPALDYAHRLPGTGNTDPGDVETVRMGMEMHNKYGSDMTSQEFEQFMKDKLPELEKHGKARSTNPR